MRAPIQFLRRPDVLALTGLSASTIRRLEQSGQFPMHFLITSRTAGWEKNAVEAWLMERVKHPVQPTTNKVGQPKSAAAA